MTPAELKRLDAEFAEATVLQAIRENTCTPEMAAQALRLRAEAEALEWDAA